MAIAPILELEQVSVLHRLDAVSGKVSRGDRIGIVGASGAGKSTFLNLLNRLIDPDSGQIEYAGKSLKTWPIQALRRQIVLVLQEPKLLGMTVAEAIAYPLRLQQQSPQMIQTKVADWCDRLHIPQVWQERHEYELSVGQRQLVTIARALVLEPQVLLLDEPTSALDVGTATQVFKVLGELPDLTWLMVNHQLDWVQQHCHRLFWFDQGQLRHDGAIATVDWPQLTDTLRTPVEDWQVEDWQTAGA
ncbi:MAG: ATP-binding cassette domain-containing protein [Cyanobacteria bacterium P01_G01_bin.54]